MLVLAPYLLAIVFAGSPSVLAVLSYVPFSAPVGMPLRVFLGQATWWEPLVSLAVLAATLAAVLRLGARIYSSSLLRVGSRTRLRDAMRARG